MRPAQAPGVVERYRGRIGERIGELTFQEISTERADHGRVLGVFICSCGVSRDYPLGRILNGRARTHCGCRTDRGAHRTHGMRNSREYSSWQSMKARCLDRNNKDYPRWGGRGVTVCGLWVGSFEAFYEHAGPRPRGTSLDRVDNNKGYEPGNVRWATPVEQQRNRRDTFVWHIKGLTFQSHGDAALHFCVSEHTIWRWVNGQFDKRRNSFTPPRGDCNAIPRY